MSTFEFVDLQILLMGGTSSPPPTVLKRRLRDPDQITKILLTHDHKLVAEQLRSPAYCIVISYLPNQGHF
jgi:hypothetical protein